MFSLINAKKAGHNSMPLGDQLAEAKERLLNKFVSCMYMYPMCIIKSLRTATVKLYANSTIVHDASVYIRASPEVHRYGIPPEFFYFRTAELPSELALNSAEFQGLSKEFQVIPQNSAVFQIRNSEFLCFSGMVHEQVTSTSPCTCA